MINLFTQRVVITANGNLQRIMSAYYGYPVNVEITRCDLVLKSTEEVIYEREVNLVANHKVFCTAISKVMKSPEFFIIVCSV